MKKVKHPKDLFIQLSDENDLDTFSFAFSDGCKEGEETDTLDPNEFDNETLGRLERLFSTAFMLIHNKKEYGKEIPTL